MKTIKKNFGETTNSKSRNVNSRADQLTYMQLPSKNGKLARVIFLDNPIIILEEYNELQNSLTHYSVLIHSTYSYVS